MEEIEDGDSSRLEAYTQWTVRSDHQASQGFQGGDPAVGQPKVHECWVRPDTARADLLVELRQIIEAKGVEAVERLDEMLKPPNAKRCPIGFQWSPPLPRSDSERTTSIENQP